MTISTTLRATGGITFAVLLGVAYSQKDAAIAPAELHRPSAQPDRIILTWASDPANSQAVTWRTSTSVEKAVAQIAEAEDGPLFKPKARTVAATTEEFQSSLGVAKYHSVRFESLKPATKYVYRVGDGFNFSEWSHFQTASDKPAPLEFIYLGDAQNDLFEMWSRVIRASFADAPKARFIVHAGDLINNAERDDQWGEWFRAAGWINQSVPSIPTPGNHEYGAPPNGVRGLNRHWRPQFTLPENGVKGAEETNYSLDIQGVRMVSLNSNVMQKEQAEWLDKLLTNNPNRWTVVTFHHPIFSTAKGRDNKDLREIWKPVFDKHRVDLVLTGHDHSYGRSNLVTGLTKKEGGTVYVVSVSGPKMYNVTKAEWMSRKAEDTQLYQIIRIDGSRLTYEARTARGDLYDAFDLLKQRPGKQNKIVERVPSAKPENLRPPQPEVKKAA
ncbi:phosphoesterase [Bryobacterales bacterium F-183]|nr:phosphoesterase [Bryobacterales bacterium F-183]